MNVDEKFKEFCGDSLNVLKKYDEDIRNRIISGNVKEFYKLDHKGILLNSITEPILKYLIYSNLCNKYMMWSESPAYKTSEHLDLAIYLEPTKSADNLIYSDKAEIAIEMKWGGICKNDTFNKWTIKTVTSDSIKLRKSKIQNKYFMQFISSDKQISNTAIENITDQIYKYIKSKRYKLSLENVFCDYFISHDSDDKEICFYIFAWKLG